MKFAPVVAHACLVPLLAALPSAAAGGETNSAAPVYQAAVYGLPVESGKFEWRDTKRNRMVPVKVYYPKTGAGPFPVIVFSHGLGGTRDGYEYLGRAWASHGYVSVHLQHHGSDFSIFQDVPPGEWMRAMRQSVANLQNAVNRPLDVSFALDQLTTLNSADGLLHQRLDLDRIGVGGHSFGAFTTMAIAGETFVNPEGGETTFADPRVKAAIAMSASVPRDPRRYDTAYAKIRIPVFHMTGTKDDSPLGDTLAAARRVPFDHITGADQYLVNFQDGDHMIFSGHLPLQGGGENDPRFHELILQASTSFWDAYLKKDAKAKAWLAGGGFDGVLKSEGKFEKKVR